jgi:FkbM family methyltransferase
VKGGYLFRAESDRPRILDCGSHIGMSVLFFKKMYPDATIIAFEPDPMTFEKLKTNVEQNSLRDVTLHQCALSDTEGSIDFYHSQENAGSLVMSMHRARIDGDKIVVPSRRLSSFISEEIDLLKIDIEGAEDVVLAELACSNKLALIKQMHIEYHHHIIPKNDKLSAMLKILENANFGYQISVAPSFGKWPTREAFQDISIYCYRKH